jgi:hypothetical protein
MSFQKPMSDAHVLPVTSSNGHEIDDVESVLKACGGDHRLAIAGLLADADFLRDQLFVASRLLSHGIGRS